MTTPSLQNPVAQDSAEISYDVKIFIERIISDRKPISILFRSSLDRLSRMSVIRAAVLLTLLLDYVRRLKGLDTLHDFDAAIKDIANQLSDNSLNLNREQIRVAKYRLMKVWQKEYQDVLQLEIDVDSFLLRKSRGFSSVLRISSSDPTILCIAHELTKESRLVKLRREKALFLPAGASAADELLYELYSQRSDITVMTAGLKPANISFPEVLLNRYPIKTRDRNYYELVNEKMVQGTLKLTEILHLSFFEQFIVSNGQDRKFSEADSLLLIRELIRKLETVSSYHLVITNAEISFLATTFNSNELDCTAFYNSGGSSGSSDCSYLFLWGESVRKSLTEGFYRWIFQHPSTIQDREVVLRYLYELYHSIYRTELMGYSEHQVSQ